MKKISGIFFVLLAFLCLTAPAIGTAALITFNLSDAGTGSISFAGGSSSLIGSGIGVSNVVGMGTPLNNEVVVPLDGFTLSFTTGAFDSSTGTFGPGGSILVSNGATDLLSGGFGYAEVVPVGPTFRFVGASFFDTLHPAVLDYFGLGGFAGVYLNGNLNLSFDAAGLPPGAFSSTMVYSGDLSNDISVVPEPGAMVLFGSYLACMTGLGLRRFRV